MKSRIFLKHLRQLLTASLRKNPILVFLPQKRAKLWAYHHFVQQNNQSVHWRWSAPATRGRQICFSWNQMVDSLWEECDQRSHARKMRRLADGYRETKKNRETSFSGQKDTGWIKSCKVSPVLFLHVVSRAFVNNVDLHHRVWHQEVVLQPIRSVDKHPQHKAVVKLWFRWLFALGTARFIFYWKCEIQFIVLNINHNICKYFIDCPHGVFSSFSSFLLVHFHCQHRHCAQHLLLVLYWAKIY